MELFLNEKLGKITLEIDESSGADAVIIIAHGAGAGMHHPFMNNLAKKICDLGITAVRFNFPYMEQGRKSPGSPKANIETWRLVLGHISSEYKNSKIYLSGKSYGGRMASHLMADEKPSEVKGLIYFGFPLHAPGKDSKDRADHLSNIEIPQLFLQGSKDKLSNLSLMKEVVAGLKGASMEVFEDADHSFNVPKKSGLSKDEVLNILATKTAKWVGV